jgi:TolB-like protein/Tfp pilus assembly protein PilF
MSNDDDKTIPPQLIQDALQRVLESREIVNSDRKKRFLKFIVQEALGGHADRIKAYTIAIDVFDRAPSFDPVSDPVVRIEAGRLRRCLEHYYLTEGHEDPLLIIIPKGSYVPQFIPREHNSSSLPQTLGDGRLIDGQMSGVFPTEASVNQVPVAATSSTPPLSGLVTSIQKHPRFLVSILLLLIMMLIALSGVTLFLQNRSSGTGRIAAEQVPVLMVLPFENDSGDPTQDIFAKGTTEEVIGALILFRNILVLGADTSFRFRTETFLHDAVPSLHVDYVLKGRLNRIGSQIQINVALLRALDQQYLWSGSFRQELNASNMMDLQQDIATQVARLLVQPYGIIDKVELRKTAGRPPGSLSSYECVLQTREYWRQPNAKQHKQVRACLERAIQEDPDYADAWAALAFIYTDEVRVDFNPSAERPDPAGAALQLAKHAVALAPDSPLPLQAVGIAHWLRREVRLSIAAYEHALALNPHDSDILADLGRAYSLTGDWDKGIPLIREAFERNPAQPSWYRQFIAMFHYMHGRYAEALEEAQKIGTPDLVYTHVVLAMIYGQTGSRDDAAHEVNEILRLYPNFGDKAVFEFERRNIDPAIIARMVDGLRKAGLDVAPQSGTASGKG